MMAESAGRMAARAERRLFLYLAALLGVMLALAALAWPGERRAPGGSALGASPQSASSAYVPLVTMQISPPLMAASHYMNTVNTGVLYNMGCAMGQRDLNLPGAQDSIVVLAFGRPVEQNGNYGASIFSNTFVSTAQIGAAAQAYIFGYWNCSGSDTSSQLRLAVGTSNFGPQVTYQHGVYWAEMVNSLGDWLLSTGYAAQIKVAGASDMELAWNSPVTTRAWLDGYDSQNDWRHYNFGAAEGCPPYGSCGTSSYPEWTSQDVWYIAWGNPAAYVLPQIYLTSGGNAAQWYNLSLYGYLNHGSRIDIGGALTQYQACQQRGCVPAVANTPEQGWTQMWTALHNDWRTAQDLPWSADMKWLDASPSGALALAAPVEETAAPPAQEEPPAPEMLEAQSLQQALEGPLAPAARASLEEKLSVVTREIEARAAAVPPPKPGEPPGPALAPAPEPERPIGILEDVQGPFSAQEFLIENAWQGRAGAEWVQVYAGALADEPARGVVIVLVETAAGGQGSLHGAPGQGGALRLVAADGLRLTLQAADGALFTFDVAARQFVEP